MINARPSLSPDGAWILYPGQYTSVGASVSAAEVPAVWGPSGEGFDSILFEGPPDGGRLYGGLVRDAKGNL